MRTYIIIVFTLFMSTTLAKNFGYTNENQKIFGGEDAEQGQFPYQVSILKYGKVNMCEGSIYSETVVITAAGCCQRVLRNNTANFEIVAGELRPTITTDFGQRLKFKNYLIHPNYTGISETNDICLIYLEDGFDLSGGNVSSIPLADKDPESGTDCTISGWRAKPTGNLKWATVSTTRNENCQNSNPELHVCAGGEGIATCNADSGGPLECNDVLVGVTRYIGIGNGCGISGVNHAYTKVSAFYDWIKDNEEFPVTTTSTPKTTPTTTTTTTTTTTSTSIASIQKECSFLGFSFVFIMMILGISN